MRKALRYILILVIVGILIIGGGLGALYFVPNTFAQDDGTQVVVIEKGQTGTEIADMLFERGLIRSTQGFKLWLYLSGTNDKLQTGHYQIPNKVTVRELISLLQEGHVESIRITIPEGYTVGDIAIVLEKNQIMKAKDFLAEAKTYVPYPYMKGTKPATYPVEGFLFPSTYEIPVGATPRDVIQMMADEMNRYLTPAVKKQIQAQHMSIHDFVTLASIVERESLFDADRPTIAGVFKKRLAHGIPLQSDATISYVLGYAKENVTIGDTQLQSPYNTYVSKGLPPGPIANPGKKALDAVLHSENTDYLYFVADREGHITSIELDDVRYEMAKYYINQSDYADKITLLKGDASQVLTELTGEYDLVFLDGPKGQYLKQLELILPHVKEGGVILADNVLFRGYVRGDKEPPKRFKTIVKRLQEYLTYVENKELFNTTIYPMGDGMSVSVWKGHNK